MMASAATINLTTPLAPRRGPASPIVSSRGSRSVFRAALRIEGKLKISQGDAIRLRSNRRCEAAASAPRAAAASTSSPSPSPSSSPSTTTIPAAPAVVLTREAGKNGKLAAALAQRGLSTLELPLVQTAEGPDAGALPGVISEAARAEEEGGGGAAGAEEGSTRKSYEWIIVTSPESASVFVGGWKAAGSPKKIRVAAVGTGTARALSAAGFSPRVEFTPSVANAVTLAAELPFVKNGCRRVLYPASAKAGSDLQDGLAARGFEVERLNTYTTLPVPRGDLPVDAVAAARRASVVALASPSAAKAWLEVIASGGGDPGSSSSSTSGPAAPSSSSSSSAVCGGVAAACIGSTTADAARKAGFERVFAPEEPGLAGFVEAVVEALEEMKKEEE